jgi:drug/metabolite transporter (DMT)-like permease
MQAEYVKHTSEPVQSNTRTQTEPVSSASIAVFLAYFIASSTMLLFNKACMIVLPAPCVVTLMQVTVTTLLICTAWCFSLVDIQKVNRGVLSQYMLYSMLFVLGINFTMRSLANTNVETVLLFRTGSPIVVSCIDTLCLGREMPSRRSAASMLCIVLGATWFAASELQTDTSSLDVPGVCVNTINLFITATLMTWGKHVTNSSDLNLTTSVFICNVTSIVPILALAVLENEHLIIREHRWLSVYAVTVLCTSCVMGTALSYLGWQMRTIMSATSFTVVGVLNKVFTVLLNGMLWPDHAVLSSTIGLIFSLVGGSFYQQAAASIR